MQPLKDQPDEDDDATEIAVFSTKGILNASSFELPP